MKRPGILLFALITYSVLFESSCTHEKLTSVCETQNMSYVNNILPILKNNCYSCHSTGNSVGSTGVLLNNYDSLMTYVTNGYLIGDITHSAGFVAMPYMKPKLDTCSINQISAWVNQGAPNN